MNAIPELLMPKRLLSFIPASLRVIAVASEPERVTVMAVPRSAAMCCPVCRRHSDQIHGSYERRLDDLPCQGRSVSLRVRLRRLCCCNPVCPRRTFSQSLPDVAVPRARRSRRLQDVQRHLGLDRKTVRRWLQRDEPPTWTKPGRPSVIDPHRAYLDRRWAEGCRNGAELARELERLGARIKPRVVRAWATARRRAGADRLDLETAGAARPWKPPGTRRVVCLLSSGVDAGDGEDGDFIKRLRRQAPGLTEAADLAARLAAMLRGHSAEAVEDLAGLPLTIRSQIIEAS